MARFSREDLKRWPLGVERLDIIKGVAYFYGDWDERDVETARRTFPDFKVELERSEEPSEGSVLIVGG